MKRHRPKYEAAKVLLEVSRVISSSLDFNKVIELVLKESRRALGTDHASLFLAEEESKNLILAAADGFSENEMDNVRLLGGWEVVNDYLASRRRVLAVNDVQKSAIFKHKKLPYSHEKMPIKSFIAAPLEKGGKLMGALIVSNRKRPGHKFTKEDEELMAALSNNIAISLLNAKLYHDLKSLFISTVTSLTRAIDAKDRFTSGHSERVMKYAVAIGREMGFDEEPLENLRLSSLLHDIGKIGIKEGILMKPAKLLGYEKRHMNMHPAIGARIIEMMDDSNKIVKGILEHHERYDGKGYPNKLKGEDISIEGRIIAVADTFDALTADRPYQKGYSRQDAFEEIKRASSTQFDPKVVSAFISSFLKNPILWRP